MTYSIFYAIVIPVVKFFPSSALSDNGFDASLDAKENTLKHQEKKHIKHYTRSEVAAQTALAELFKMGFMSTTIHTDAWVLDSPIFEGIRMFIFEHSKGHRTQVVLRSQDEGRHWESAHATIKIGEEFWIFDRFLDPITYWVPRKQETEPNFNHAVL